MNVVCQNCKNSYELPDNRLPVGRVVTFSCPGCKKKVTLDLRDPAPDAPEEPEESSNKIVFKPLDDSSDSTLGTEDLKKKILNRIKDLPPMPKVLFKAREIMADPKSSFKEIAKIIETDQAIAAKVLKVANSAYYGLSGMVNSIHQASVVLGYQTLEQVITMVSTSSLLGKQLKGYNISAGGLWRHSLGVALGSRMIAQKRVPSMEGDAFSVGLIHDAGKLAMDHYVVQRKRDIQQYLAEQSPSFLQAERNIIGFDHTEIAYELCQKWKLPDSHIEAMRHHHTPGAAKENDLVHIIHVANYMSHLVGLGCGPAFDGEPLDPGSMKALNLKEPDLETISAEVLSAVEEISASLSG
jgi:HD-like signal output (HDOD) protein